MSTIDDYKHAMKMVEEIDRGTDGWIVDYKAVERITAKACQIESVSMEGTEAVILAMIDEHFAKLKDEYSIKKDSTRFPDKEGAK